MLDRPYQPAAIESKWQQKWESTKIFEVNEAGEGQKYYVLEMLPYPSGRIHMGHVRNYSIGDVAARYWRMKGAHVLHPMGWDAFGLPAENAAIKQGVHPATWTKENIDSMRVQLKRLGFSYDWSREFATCDPSSYRWEQFIFLKMFEKGWVYRKTSQVNWCPGCQTVLANEQVEKGGCWRCESQVELKSMAQWYFRITDYAEELLQGIEEKLQGWPERVRSMQREWIGKSEGAYIDFPIEGDDEAIRVFTTRPDTLYGVTFLSLAPEHPLLERLILCADHANEVKALIEQSRRISHQDRLADAYEKRGAFTGRHALHPLTREKIPLCVANFVLMDYGAGAVMAVPAHDQRDFEFAKKYQLPLKVVIQPQDRELDPTSMTEAFCDAGILVHSASFSGMPSHEAIAAITKELEKKRRGEGAVTYRLKDWCVSRQRYWGAPIPIIHCDMCGIVPVPEEELPVELPHDIEFTGKGGSPLSQSESFVKIKCPQCGKQAQRETDTMDTFVESSWYFFRYADPHNAQAPVAKEAVKRWFPIDQYIGGIEHAVGHLIYCRYFTKVMRDLGMIDLDEPVANLMTQGMVVKDGAKMSKSKGNVVDPDEMIEKYGADAVRLFMLFAAPPVKDLEWSEKGLEGQSRFLAKVWRFVHGWDRAQAAAVGSEELLRWEHGTIKRVSHDIERWHHNTAIAAIMEYLNFLIKLESHRITESSVKTLLLVLSPFAPHMVEELWEELGEKVSILHKAWPGFDPGKIASDKMQIIVQVNGKLRDRIVVHARASEEEVKAAALASEKVKIFLEGKKPKRIIFVKGKLVNIVVLGS